MSRGRGRPVEPPEWHERKVAEMAADADMSRHTREMASLSRAQLAAALGVSVSRVAQVEQRRATWTESQRSKILAIAGTAALGAGRSENDATFEESGK